jgi:hypothetical protein
MVLPIGFVISQGDVVVDSGGQLCRFRVVPLMRARTRGPHFHVRRASAIHIYTVL